MNFSKYVDQIIVEYPSMSSSAAAVLRAIARRADNTTGECFPSNRDICEYTHLSKPTVKRAKNELYALGVLELVAERMNEKTGAQTSNLYRVVADAAAFAMVAAKMAAKRLADKARLEERIKAAAQRKKELAEQLAAMMGLSGNVILESAASVFFGGMNPGQDENEPPITVSP